MDRVIAPLGSVVNSRNHRRAHYTLTQKEFDRRAHPYEEEVDPADEPLIRERRRRTIMSNSHRRFHKRAPQAGTNIKTVNVEVVATVDTAGNVVAQTTVTQPDSAAPTEPSLALPITSATDVSAPSTTPELPVPAAADAASTLEVPSIATLPVETQPAVPSTVPSVSVPAEPTVATVASVPALPSVPSVPAVPSVALPSVPAVPPFPSTLTVPAYPFASPIIDAVSSAASNAVSSSASSAEASSEPSIVAALTAAGANSTTSSISGSTSISSSILASSPTLLSTMSGFTYSLSAAAFASQTASSSGASLSGSSTSTPSPSTGSSARATPTESLDAAGSSSFYGSGGAGWNGGGETATAGSPAETDVAAAGGADTTGTTPLDTPQVVGSVVGSLAGAALILAIILMLLRRHKRRQTGALQLTDSHRTDNEQAMRQVQEPRQLQAAAPARASFVPSTFLNRFSGLSRSTAETSTPSEPSFQRVSGRKLPSAFSEGMTSDQFARGGHMSESSFYQDDHGIYGGPGVNKEYGGAGVNKEHGGPGVTKEFGGGLSKEMGATPFAGAGTMNVRPSPARTPVIHHPGENPFDDTNRTLSPPMSPNPFSSPTDAPLRTALGRSLHSADGSRSSRFTENV